MRVKITDFGTAKLQATAEKEEEGTRYAESS